MENHEYLQGVSSKSLAHGFKRHASQTQDCRYDAAVSLMFDWYLRGSVSLAGS